MSKWTAVGDQWAAVQERAYSCYPSDHVVFDAFDELMDSIAARDFKQYCDAVHALKVITVGSARTLEETWA